MIPDWWFRLIVDKKNWEMYPWGYVVWRQLYHQLKDANCARSGNLYAVEQPLKPDRPCRPEASGSRREVKYSLSGFTYAFKTWILETYKIPALKYYKKKKRYPRAVV